MGTNAEEIERSYLNADQLKHYVKLVTDKGHMIIIRMLVNGVSLKEINKLRAKDIKARRNQLLLKKPKRRVTIDEVTMSLIASYLSELNVHYKSREKAIAYHPATIHDFISEYGRRAGFGFPVTSQTLINTFFILRLVKNPDWTIEDYNRHLGRSSLDHTKKLLDYFRSQVEEIEKKG